MASVVPSFMREVVGPSMAGISVSISQTAECEESDDDDVTVVVAETITEVNSRRTACRECKFAVAEKLESGVVVYFVFQRLACNVGSD